MTHRLTKRNLYIVRHTNKLRDQPARVDKLRERVKTYKVDTSYGHRETDIWKKDVTNRQTEEKHRGDICLFVLSYFHPLHYNHRRLEGDKREEQNRGALETLVP